MTALRGGALVLFLAVAAYGNSLGNGFAYDDNAVLVLNPVVTSSDWKGALDSPYHPDALEGAGLYRPLTSLSFALEWGAFGGDPMGFHLVNVVTHALVCLLLFFLLLELAPPLGALAGGAVFAVHPLHTEAVANVVGRAELYAALFFLAACLLYWRGAGWKGGWRLLRLVALGGLYALSLGAKEIGVTLPLVLLLLEVVREGRPTRALGREAATFSLLLVVLLAYLAFRGMVLGTVTGEVSAPVFRILGPGERILTAIALWPHYLRLLLFPLDLSADYAPGVLFPAEGLDAGVLLGLAILAGLGVLVVRGLGARPARGNDAPRGDSDGWTGPPPSGNTAWDRGLPPPSGDTGSGRGLPPRTLVGLGAAWFFLVILPVSNLLFPVGVLLAERTLYLPSAGLAFAVAGVAVWAKEGSPRIRRAALAGGIVVLTGLTLRTVLRNPAWMSTYTVLETLNQEHPESHLAFLNRGRGLERVGEEEAAREEYAMALRLAPERYGTLTAVAGFLGRMGEWRESERLLRRAMALAPSRDDAYRLLAAQMLRQERGRDAHRVALAGLARAGFHQDLWGAVSESYLLRGDLEAALRARRAALAADPESPHHRARMEEIREAIRDGGEGEASTRTNGDTAP